MDPGDLVPGEIIVLWWASAPRNGGVACWASPPRLLPVCVGTDADPMAATGSKIEAGSARRRRPDAAAGPPHAGFDVG